MSVTFKKYLENINEPNKTSIRKAARGFLKQYHTNKTVRKGSIKTDNQSLFNATEAIKLKKTVKEYLESNIENLKNIENFGDLKSVVVKINSVSKELLKKIENLIAKKDIFLFTIFYFMVENRVNEFNTEQNGGNGSEPGINTNQIKVNMLENALRIINDKDIKTFTKSEIETIIHNAFIMMDGSGKNKALKLVKSEIVSEIMGDKKIMGGKKEITKDNLVEKIKEMMKSITNPKKVVEEEQQEKEVTSYEEEEKEAILSKITNLLKNGFDFKGLVILFFIFAIVISIYFSFFHNLVNEVKGILDQLLRENINLTEVSAYTANLDKFRGTCLRMFEKINILDETHKKITVALGIVLKDQVSEGSVQIIHELEKYVGTFYYTRAPTKVKDLLEMKKPTTLNIGNAIKSVKNDKLKDSLHENYDKLVDAETTLSSFISITNTNETFFEVEGEGINDINEILNPSKSTTRGMAMNQPKRTVTGMAKTGADFFDRLINPKKDKVTELLKKKKKFESELEEYLKRQGDTIPGTEGIKHNIQSNIVTFPARFRGAMEQVYTGNDALNTIDRITTSSTEISKNREQLKKTAAKNAVEAKIEIRQKFIFSQIMETVLISLQGESETTNLLKITDEEFMIGMDRHLKLFYLRFVQENLKKLKEKGNEMEELIKMKETLREVEFIFRKLIYSSSVNVYLGYNFFSGGNINFNLFNKEFESSLREERKFLENDAKPLSTKAQEAAKKFVKGFVPRLKIRGILHGAIYEIGAATGVSVHGIIFGLTNIDTHTTQGQIYIAFLCIVIIIVYKKLNKKLNKGFAYDIKELKEITRDLLSQQRLLQGQPFSQQQPNYQRQLVLQGQPFSQQQPNYQSQLLLLQGQPFSQQQPNYQRQPFSQQQRLLLQGQPVYQRQPVYQQPHPPRQLALSASQTNQEAVEGLLALKERSGGKRKTKNVKNKKQTKKIRRKPKMIHKSMRKKSRNTKKRSYVKTNMKRTIRKKYI